MKGLDRLRSLLVDAWSRLPDPTPPPREDDEYDPYPSAWSTYGPEVVEELVKALNAGGYLPTETEWDVRYTYPDGSTALHTEISSVAASTLSKTTPLTEGMSVKIAANYNALNSRGDNSPHAEAVYRRAFPWRTVGDEK